MSSDSQNSHSTLRSSVGPVGSASGAALPAIANAGANHIGAGASDIGFSNNVEMVIPKYDIAATAELRWRKNGKALEGFA